MATIINIPEQGLNELLHTNQEMHNIMLGMSKLLSSLVDLMQRDVTPGEPDLERGVRRRRTDPAPSGYRLRAAPMSFRLGESDAAGNMYPLLRRQDTGIESISESFRMKRQLMGPQRRRSSPRNARYTDSDGSSDDENDTWKDDPSNPNQPLTQRAMSFILKEEMPGMDEYNAHFQALPDELPTSQANAVVKAIDWKAAVVSGLNASAPSLTDERNRLGASIFAKYASEMMCSLFLSEITYPYFKNMSKVQFETMHAPRLYEFLESTMAPYAWRSDQVISHFHPIEQHFDWEVALRLVCLIGVALQRAQHERTDDFNYYTAGLGDRTGEETVTRFELILENESVKAGLLPTDRGGQGRLDWRVNLRHESTYWLAEKVRRDFLVDDPGLSDTPWISSLASKYHGATYVPQPDPIINDHSRDRWIEVEPEREQTMQWRIRAEALLSSPTFEPIDLALETIKATRKEWSIVWTSNLREHLWIQDLKIFVYWCPTTLFHRPKGPRRLEIEELRKTYGLLFASTAKGLAGQRRRLIGETDKYSVNGRPLKSFEKITKSAVGINPLETPYKSLLNTWLSTPCPHHIAQVFAHTSPTTDMRTGLVPETNIRDVLALRAGSDIPEDLVIQLQGILLYPHKSTSEDYSDYPYFGERLRHMNYVLQKQKPRSLTELWRDQRDSLQWWTFWLVAWFGIASVLLALGALVTGVVQTWAAFRALGLN